MNYTVYVHQPKHVEEYRLDTMRNMRPYITRSNPVGLYNVGNTCFINSLMQCFASLRSLNDFMKAKLPNEALFLRILQAELAIVANAPDFVPVYGFSKVFLSEIYKRMHLQWNVQADAGELFGFILQDAESIAPKVRCY